MLHETRFAAYEPVPCIGCGCAKERDEIVSSLICWSHHVSGFYWIEIAARDRRKRSTTMPDVISINAGAGRSRGFICQRIIMELNPKKVARSESSAWVAGLDGKRCILIPDKVQGPSRNGALAGSGIIPGE